jgi:hypothetical protein
MTMVGSILAADLLRTVLCGVCLQTGRKRRKRTQALQVEYADCILAVVCKSRSRSAAEARVKVKPRYKRQLDWTRLLHRLSDAETALRISTFHFGWLEYCASTVVQPLLYESVTTLHFVGALREQLPLLIGRDKRQV